MKKFIFGATMLLLSTTVFAAAGDVIFNNNGANPKVNSPSAVQFMIVTQDGRITYTDKLSAIPGANTTTLTKAAFETKGNTKSFDVYIKNVETGGKYSKEPCLPSVVYNPTWKVQQIFGWAKGTKFACALGK